MPSLKAVAVCSVCHRWETVAYQFDQQQTEQLVGRVSLITEVLIEKEAEAHHKDIRNCKIHRKDVCRTNEHRKHYMRYQKHGLQPNNENIIWGARSMDYNWTLKTCYEINRNQKHFMRYQKHSNNIGIIGLQNIMKLDSQHHREQTCFLPRTPRCGVAKVIKLTGSSPAIIPCVEGVEVCKFPSEESVTLLDWVPLESHSE